MAHYQRNHHHHQQQHYGHPRGGGGGRRGGRGGGGGGGRGYPSHGRDTRPASMNVLTNMFSVELQGGGIPAEKWYQYSIEILDARRVVINNDNAVKNEESKGGEKKERVYKIVPIPRRTRPDSQFSGEGGQQQHREMDLERGSSVLSRRILLKAQQEMANKGHRLVVSNESNGNGRSCRTGLVHVAEHDNAVGGATRVSPG